jgi:polyisoprenyl-teichoic acid--peptidoglycan teichoic acid transferase
MSARRKLVAMAAAITVAAAGAWTVVGGMSVAQGQTKPIEIHRAHAGSFRPSFNKPIFILAIGSDSGSKLFHRGGTPQHGRSDSIHIIAINPRLHKATLVGIPRDSYVPIACGSSPNKINASMFFGGPQCLVKTIENLSGGTIRFDYYMVGSFDSLVAMVNDIGGVTVQVDPGLGSSKRRLQDHNSRATGIKVGTTHLNGRDALAYSRDRHDYGRGDFDRTRHQGLVLMGGLTQARKLVKADPGKTLTFLRSIFRNVKTDIPLSEALRLGLLALDISPADVTNTFLDGGTGTTPAGSSVLLSNPQRLLRNVADDAIID